MSGGLHRVEPRVAVLIALLTIGAAPSRVAGPAATTSTASGQKVADLPGTIPKSPPLVSGFPILFYRTVDYRPREGSVRVADLEPGGRPELIVSVPSGVITVLRADGTRMPGWPREFAGLPQPAYPVGAPGVGDLDRDGRPEIVTCVVAGGSPRRSFLFALSADGTDLPGWPVEVRTATGGPAACSASGVLLADLDGDRRMEVLRAVIGGEIVAFDAGGVPVTGWPLRLGPDRLGRIKEINAELTAVDFDGDGREEVVLVESGYSPRLAVVGGDGRVLPGFPAWLPEVTDRQAPATADLDGDGRPELVQATLPLDASGALDAEPAPGEEMVPAALHVVRGDGTARPGWPRPLQSGAPWGALLIDLDGDGRPDVLQQDGDTLVGLDAWGEMLPAYPQRIHRDFVRAQSIDLSPWIAADLDGDRRVDLLQARSNVYDGSAYLRLMGIGLDGRPVRGFPFDALNALACSRPVVADLTGDGVGDLIVLAGEGTQGGWSLVAWDLGALRAR